MGRPRKDRTEETRLADSREANQRPMPRSGYQGRLYVDPRKIPPGWTYGWVRISTFNEPDSDNWDQKSSEGWEPVARTDHPEMGKGLLMPGKESDPFQNFIVRGGLVLCKKPTSEVDAAKEHFRAMAMQQFQKISEWRGGADRDPNVPRFDESKVSYGNEASFKKD